MNKTKEFTKRLNWIANRLSRAFTGAWMKLGVA